ncbi:type II CRISPR RNA-guided endonuclease Cas9 [Metamycoplasma alkalescens]|uniref:CRISPR-associated endonuclease Csn1 n=2 Tax=Metamycoplasma alkalescens TaxID=45363 RepID=A0A318U464_9BACT|nr:type II CRISPR RNA-guided endonuclease Cas9 [Metamycoplasma alkalescens]PYF41929.1 CRISPR-associated endonuclease Csn1 [Metamycoplasma alkalescens]
MVYITTLNSWHYQLFSYVREFQWGPGSKHSISPYGISKFDENGNPIGNIWDKTLKKCSLYTNENTISVAYPSYELFNLLNDLANIRSEINRDWKLDLDVKKKLLSSFLEKTIKNKRNADIEFEELEKIFKKDNNLESDSKSIIDGRSVLKKLGLHNKITTLNTMKLLIRIISEFKPNETNWINIDNLFEFLNIFDDICAIIENPKLNDAIYKEFSDLEIIKRLELKQDSEGEFISKILDNLNKKKFDFSKNGNLSRKAINLYLPKMFEKNLNSEELKWKDKDIQKEIEELKSKKELGKKTKYLDPFIFKDEIISPTAKQTFEQSIKVLNRIIKLYSNEYKIEKIVVEIPKTKNDPKTKQNLIKSNQEKGIKQIYEKLELDKDGIKLEEFKEIARKSNALIEKLKLFIQQDGHDLYSPEKIKLPDLLNNISKYEIDHIIPYSMSYDNSILNKVLTLKANNASKGNKTAYEFISQYKPNELKTYLEKCEKLFVKQAFKKSKNKSAFELSKEDATKKYKLLTLEDFNNYDQIEFINRNLNDTRYATKLFVDLLRDHFSDKTLIIGINGHVTNYFRSQFSGKNWEYVLRKNRSLNDHHAIDASILALIANNDQNISRLLTLSDNNWEIKDDNPAVHKYTGENKKNVKNLKVELLKNLIRDKLVNKINEINSKIKYSRKIKILTNGKIFSDNLYSLIKIDAKNGNAIKKIKLMKSKNSDLKKYFDDDLEKRKDSFLVLMAENNPNEFKKLKEIFNIYYCQEKSNKEKPNQEESKKEKSNGNFFVKYMNDLVEKEILDKEIVDNAIATKKVIVLLDDNKNLRYIKTLRILEKAKIPLDYKYIKKYENSSKLAFKDSNLSLLSLVYQIEENDFRSIPINFLSIQFDNKKEKDWLNEDIYKKDGLVKKMKEDLKINANLKPLFVLKKGMILKRKNLDKNNEENYFYISGISKRKIGDTKYAIKYLLKDSKIKDEKQGKVKNNIPELSTTSLLEKFEIINMDELGNEYKFNINK